MLSLVLFFIMVFLVFTTPLFYAVLLLVLSAVVIYYVIFMGLLPGLVGLLILLVYYSAMMILISYVCSIAPNVSYEASLVFSPESIFTIAIVLGGVFLSSALFSTLTPKFGTLSLTPFFYSFLGAYMFMFICVLMMFVLLFCSLYTHVSSPFRSMQ